MPVLAAHLRAKRRTPAGRAWYVDETDVEVNGQWCSLYRAIDRDGNQEDADQPPQPERPCRRRKAGE